MKKKLIIILVAILIALIIAGGGMLIYKQNREEKKEREKLYKNIAEQYKIFREKVEDFNSERHYYSDSVGSNLFPETVEEYENWIKELDKYTEAVTEIQRNSDFLLKKCVNHYFSDRDTKNKCEAFVIAYETAVNYYVKDVTTFNKTMKELSTKNNELKEYELSFEYVDIDDNGKYYGKE